MIMTEPASRKAPKPPREPAEPQRLRRRRAEEMELVKRARQGDLAAYDDLVRRYQERIYATVYHMTSNHEDANDLAQEAFIKAFQALKILQGRLQLLHLGLSDCGQQDHQLPQAAEEPGAHEPGRSGLQRRARSRTWWR